MISKAIAIALTTTATLLTIGIAAPAVALDERKQAQANFRKADTNQDQQLDFSEFKTFINLNADHKLGRAGMIRSFGMHGRAFNTLDANGDGVVTRHEIAAKAQR